MKFKKYCLIIIVFIIAVTDSVAQTNVILPLKIGAAMPDIEIGNLINYPSNKFKFSELKGKLVILDFWGVHCSSCIKEMPKIMKLQKLFNSRLQFFLVTTDSKNEVNRLRHTSPIFKNVDLPLIFGDTILSKLFPYSAYGLHVWIDTTGTLQLKTDGESYTATDIRHFLAGEKVNLIERADTINFNRYVPLWLEGNGRQLKYFRYYSFITENIPGYASSAGNLILDSVSHKIVGVRLIDNEIASLFIKAYSEWGKIKWDKFILDVKDSSKYLMPSDPTGQYKWFRENTFSYELRVPASKYGELFSFMRQDLQRYFGLIGKIEDSTQNCWLLKKQNKKIFSDSKEFLSDSKYFKFNKITLAEFAKQLSSFVGIAVIDETSYKGKISLSIPPSKSFKELCAVLKKQGLVLVKASRPIKVFKLSEPLDYLSGI